MGAEGKPEGTPVTRGKEIITSGYIATTPEVNTMRTRFRERKAPIFWYELVQGGADYDDETQGPPSIVYELIDGRRQLFPDYNRLNPNVPIKAIEVRNFIAEGQNALTPFNLTQMAHEGGPDTLGQHGRGMTAAATMVVADGLCSSITYSSRDEFGAWRGRGLMHRTRADQKYSEFGLEYERTGEEVNETVIRVEDPAAILVESLRALPDYFLLANPRYMNSQFAGGEEVDRVPNLLTVSAVPPSAMPPVESGGWQYFSPAQIDSFRFDHSDPTSPELAASEPALARKIPRVEIVPGTVVNEDGETVFVDGLRVQKIRPWVHNLFTWSFYGFGRAGDWQSAVRRSHDSSTATGDTDRLMALALSHCQNPEIFRRIIQASAQGRSFAEATLSQEYFAELDAPVEEAIRVAWEDVKRELGFEGEVVITGNEILKRQADEEGLPTILINSRTFQSIIQRVAGVRSIEEMMVQRAQ